MNNNNGLPKEIVAAQGGLSFGDYTASEKIKVNDFNHMGNVYNLRAHNLVTRLEKNGELLFEAVPGVAVYNFNFDEKGCTFEIENPQAAQITLGLEPEITYDLAIGDNTGNELREEITANRSGKVSFGVELEGLKKKVNLGKL